MIAKLDQRFSGFLAKAKMFSSIPFQRVITNNGEQFDLLKLGLFPVTEDGKSNFVRGDSDVHENIELVSILPNCNYQKHYHKYSCAVIYIISGTGKFLLGNEIIDYKPSVRVIIPCGTRHGFVTHSKTLFLSIQSPNIIDPKTGAIDIYFDEETP